MQLAKWLAKHEFDEVIVAKFLGCSVYAIRKWVNGEREPRWDQREAIMRMTKNAVMPNDWHENRRDYERNRKGKV
jgi:hypothetical protein